MADYRQRREIEQKTTRGILAEIETTLKSATLKNLKDYDLNLLSEDVQVIFSFTNERQLAWLTVEAFARITKLSLEDAQNYLDEHGTPLEKEGWHEIGCQFND